MKRKILCPEVVQTSDMDCGPASLTALLNGLDMPVPYEQLRELCQTDVDGTSIDAIEEVAIELGAEAEQLIVPPEHVLSEASAYLPAIVVTVLPNGFAHFVVAWRVHGPWVQIMDPASGRLFVRRDVFIKNLYRHTLTVPEEDWMEWVQSEDFGKPFASRLEALGSRNSAERYEAASESAEEMRRTIAAVQMVESLCRTGALSKGKEAVSLLDSSAESDSVPESFRVVEGGQSEDGTPLTTFTGAVLVTFKGIQQREDHEPAQTSAPTRPAASRPLASPLADAFRFVRADGTSRLTKVLSLTFVVALCLIVEAIILRALFELPRWLELPEQRLLAAGGIGAFFLLFLLADVIRDAEVLKISRTFEARIRLAISERLRRIPEHYFRSRPVSDLASRAHHAHRVRMIPDAAGELSRLSAEMLFTVVALLVVSPAAGLTALLLAPILLGIPLSLRWLLTERDLTVETHAGAISRFYLDAMRGCFAVRTHRAESAVKQEHRSLLLEWGRSALSFHRLATFVQSSTSTFGALTAIAIVYAHLSSGGGLEILILVTYWGVALPTIGEQIALVVRQYPMARSAFLRATEPLRADPEPEQQPDDSGDSTEDEGPHSIDFEHVSVSAAGQTILRDIDYSIPAGAHVAVVGASGSGKSTLIATMLGLTHIESGSVRINGTPLGEVRPRDLHKSIVWIDPSVQVWNDSLAYNLRYGNAENDHHIMDQISDSELIEVLKRLPNGLQTILGENGGLLSGGETQRTRIGRALGRDQASLVLLDEAFRGLEGERRRRLMESLRGRWSTTTLVCVTHDCELASHFPEVIVMEDGRIAEAGSPQTLLESPGPFASMLEDYRRAQEIWQSESWRKVLVSNGTAVERTG